MVDNPANYDIIIIITTTITITRMRQKVRHSNLTWLLLEGHRTLGSLTVPGVSTSQRCNL
jgi:hypothetical protein